MGTPLFNRSAKITIDTIEIENLAFSFRVKKDLKGTPNTAEVSVWNLNPDHRSAIEHLKAAAVKVEAGYKDATSVIFIGDLRTAISETQGQDIVTTLASGDGEKAIRKARVNISVAKTTAVNSVLKSIAKAMGVDDGNLNSAAASLSFLSGASTFAEGAVISGNAARELTHLCRSVGLTWSVQNGKLQLLSIATSLKGEAIKLTPNTGLVGSPTVDNKGVLKCTMLLAPDVFPGRQLVIESQRLKGSYRIEATEHHGDTFGADWYVDIEAKRY